MDRVVSTTKRDGSDKDRQTHLNWGRQTAVVFWADANKGRIKGNPMARITSKDHPKLANNMADSWGRERPTKEDE